MPNPFDPNTLPDDETKFSDVSLDTYVGEGQKYRDPNELAKAYAHADDYIQTLKAKDAEREARLKVLEDMLEARLKTGTEPKIEERKPEGERNTPAPPPNQKTVDSSDIERLVRENLVAASEEQRRANNINAAAEVLNRQYGSAAKAQEAIRNRAEQLGVGFEWLRDVAANSPSAFYASMGIDLNAQSRSTPGYSPEVALRPGTNGSKGFKFYDGIRKTDPKLYNSREIQSQMFAARRELGDKFWTV